MLNGIFLNINNVNILHDINLSVNDNEILTIIGPNGSGKTSLIRIISGFIKPTSGYIKRYRDVIIGYMPQSININESMPITVKLFLDLMIKDQNIDYDICEYVGITKILNNYMYNLSEGEMKKVLLVQCLLRKPNLLILDEPVNGMDVMAENKFYKLIYNIKQQYNCTIVLVSHDLHTVMCNSDRVICLNKHICCEGHPNDVKMDHNFISIYE